MLGISWADSIVQLINLYVCANFHSCTILGHFFPDD